MLLPDHWLRMAQQRHALLLFVIAPRYVERVLVAGEVWIPGRFPTLAMDADEGERLAVQYDQSRHYETLEVWDVKSGRMIWPESEDEELPVRVPMAVKVETGGLFD